MGHFNQVSSVCLMELLWAVVRGTTEHTLNTLEHYNSNLRAVITGGQQKQEFKMVSSFKNKLI